MSNRNTIKCGVIAIAALVTLSSIACADSYTVAKQLGSVLAAEKFCEMTFNTDAISTFITNKVAADDMDFTSNIDLVIFGAKDDQEKMGTTQKIVHCTQMKRVAKHLNFTE